MLSLLENKFFVEHWLRTSRHISYQSYDAPPVDINES